MLSKSYRVIFIGLAVMLAGGFSSASYAASLGEKYNLDLSNFITFQNGTFKEQYVTASYTSESLAEHSIDDTSASAGRSSALENETICLVTGKYSVSSSSIQLNYESDSCGNKQGATTAFLDANAETVTIEEKTFRSVSAVGTSRSTSRRTLRESASDAPVQDGETSEAPITETAEPETSEETLASSDTADIEASYQNWQSNTAKAMEDLNNNSGGMWYCSSGRPRLSSTYWTWTSSVGSGGWIPSSQVKPSEAVNWYFGQISSDEACTECLMAARASFYKGLLDTIGVAAFDQWFENHRSDLVISNNSYAPSPIRMNKPISSEADLSRGDWVYFQNWVTYSGCPDINLMQRENAITQSSGDPKTFIGLGIPGRGGAPVLGQSILDDLRGAWEGTSCPQEREGKLRTDIVATASAAYFEQVINATTTTPTDPTEPTDPTDPHSGDSISIDGDFGDWGNVTPLADSVLDGGVIDWDKVWFSEGTSQLSFSYTDYNQFQTSNYEAEPYYWNIFLDSDNQTSTGYQFGVLSADYLVAGKNLYRYTGNGSSWAWSYMEDVSHAFNGSRVELAINKSSLGLSSESSSHRALFWGQHPSDNKSDYIMIGVNADGSGEVLGR